ncbi:hypothetical protein [uncultured Sphingomonas sp.]|nr:hypothetical protein [uncultured Sphingomonas sp.]
MSPIADQLQVGRVHAEKQGSQIVDDYTDHAIFVISHPLLVWR